MFLQNWILPEPAADTYPDTLVNSAKEFSDTALIVFSYPGAEQVDLPKNITGLTCTENSDSYQGFPAGRHYLELSRSEADDPQIKSVVWCPGRQQRRPAP